MEERQATTVIEAALLCAEGSMTVAAIQKLFEPDPIEAQQVKSWLESIQIAWQDRGLELVETAAGWRFQSKTAMQRYLERLSPEQTPKYSRAVLETLAIIAWKQPVTRGDIEAIRGVTVSSQIIKTLEDRGWIEAIGYRDGPGRPALLGTTKQFLDDLGLRALDELPPLVPIEQDVPSGAELALGALDERALAPDGAPIVPVGVELSQEVGLQQEHVDAYQTAQAGQSDSPELDSAGGLDDETQTGFDAMGVPEMTSASQPAEFAVKEDAMPQDALAPSSKELTGVATEHGHGPIESFESDDEKDHNHRSAE